MKMLLACIVLVSGCSTANIRYMEVSPVQPDYEMPLSGLIAFFKTNDMGKFCKSEYDGGCLWKASREQFEKYMRILIGGDRWIFVHDGTSDSAVHETKHIFPGPKHIKPYRLEYP